MNIKEITIKNYRSYYGLNTLKISPGLTLIIGGNGDGKTTFFEAIEWLFMDTDDKSSDHFSAMKKSEMKVGDRESVSVSILFDHYNGEKELTKTLEFEKRDDNSLVPTFYEYIGYDNAGPERRSMPGQTMLEICFNPAIREYCLFKGEQELNIFEKSTALKTLVDTFSGINRFDKFVEISNKFYIDADKARKNELNKDEKAAKDAKILESRREINQRYFDAYNRQYNDNLAIIEEFNEKIEKISENEESYKKIREITQEIEDLKKRREKVSTHMGVNYNYSLLDDAWILCAFPPILEEFRNKVNYYSVEKRRVEQEELAKRNIAKGKKQAIEEIKQLANGAAPLPYDLPDVGTLEEMIHDEVCKVCGTPAPKGSAPYNFMVKKLNDYLAHIAPEKEETNEEEPEIYENSYVEEIKALAIKTNGADEQRIKNMLNTIIEKMILVNDMTSRYKDLSKKIDDRENDLVNFNIQHPNISKEESNSSLDNLKGYYQQKDRAFIENTTLLQKIEKNREEKKKIDEDSLNLKTTSEAKRYQKISYILENIKDAFEDAKEENVKDFINLLEKEANKYLKLLNQNDFSGKIRIRRIKDKAKISLCSSDDTIITNPNGALRTTLYMSILFAISQITTLTKEEDYPLIFDAPTSSFEDSKEDIFYNVIDQINKQCIIVTKDLLITDKETGQKHLDKAKTDKLTCNLYRISKQAGFDEDDLSTIRTIITPIKQS